MSGEQELIERIRRAIPSRPQPAGLTLGIGDDAALLRAGRRTDWALSCDSFLEKVHFLGEAHAPEAIGYKSLARATSDLAAMGARPRFFLLSLALPARRTGRWLDRFLTGMARAAKKFQLLLIGGDTAQNATVAVSITVLGEVAPGRAVTRAGARLGDLIYVSGRPGAAQLGLELVLRGLQKRSQWKSLLRAHLYPELRLPLGEWLARRRLASAMIDTSDGLSTDLEHLTRASGVGARVWLDRIPAVRVPPALQARGVNPVELALHGGEDYELLFTVPRRLATKIPASLDGVRLTKIGEIIRERKLWLVDANGRSKTLVGRGWDHFRSP